MSTNSTKLEPRGVNTDATFNFANLSVTSNVTTANLTVSGKSNLGEISNVTVTGGASGQVVQTDGSGGLSWVDVSSIVGQAAGPGNSIQFNDAGSINGDSKLKFNKTSGVLSVTGNIEASYFSGNGSLLSNVTGANVTGFVSNATHANSATTSTTATTAGTVTSNAQPNITSIGTLSTLSVTDTITSVTISATDINGKIKTATQNEITSLGTLTGLAVSGTTQTTTLTATNLNGTIKTASQPEITGIGTLTALTVSGIGNISTLRTDIIQYSNGATYQFAMTPPGLDTQITFNDLGEYASSSNLVFNKTTKTLTVDNIISNGSQLTNVPAGNLTGTIPDTLLGNSTFYIGTTSIKANRASTSQSLTGITSIDGSAASLTTARNINGVSFNGTSDITVTANAQTLTGTILKSTIVDSSLTSVGTLTQLNVSGNSSFTGENVSLGGNSNVKITGGSSGAVLSTDGAGNLSWTSVPVIPALSGQSGNFLTTNGSTLSWVTLGSVTLPSTSGQSGKYLTNDGTTSLWASGAVYTAVSITNGTSNIIIPTSSGPVRTYVGSTLKLDVNSTNVLINGTQLSINIATGTAPLEILSTTRVANLNVAKAGLADQVQVNSGEGTSGTHYIVASTGRSGSYYTQYGTSYLTADTSTGSVTSTGTITANRLVSTVTTGNVPIIVTSTTRVANLNVATSGQTDQVQVNSGEGTSGTHYIVASTGRSGSYYTQYGTSYLTVNTSTGDLTSTGNVTANRLVSSVATGTAPIIVTSTTRVANLNVAHSGMTDQVQVNSGEGTSGTHYIVASTGRSGSYYTQYGTSYLTANPSTGDLNSTGNVTANRLISTVLTTTNLPPMYISSTVRVANLNVAKAGLTDQVQVNSGEGTSGTQYLVTSTNRSGSYYTVYGTSYLTADPSTGSVTSTGNVSANRLVSTVLTTTNLPPMYISSTVRVANLNVAKAGLADQVQVNSGEGTSGTQYLVTSTNRSGSYYTQYGTSYLTADTSTGSVTSTGNITANRLISSVATGTAPIIVTSTTRVTNLNVAHANISDFASVTTQSTSTYYPVFASGATTSNYALGSNTALKFDAATGNLQTTVVYVTANITSGNASLGNLVGANYVSLTNNITTPNASIGNITSNISLLGWTTIQKSTELMVSPSFASTIICDLDTSSIFYISPTSNFTVNFTNVPTTINRTIVVTLILAQTTGYYASAVQIGGAGQTIKWSYGSTPVPTANKTEIETITLIRTSAGAWVVLGDYGTYG